MSPDGMSLLIASCVVSALLCGLGLGVFLSWRLTPPRVVYRDPPTLQEVWFRVYREARSKWALTGSTNIEGVEALEAVYRKTADAAVASAKKTKCWQCGAPPMLPGEAEPTIEPRSGPRGDSGGPGGEAR